MHSHWTNIKSLLVSIFYFYHTFDRYSNLTKCIFVTVYSAPNGHRFPRYDRALSTLNVIWSVMYRGCPNGRVVECIAQRPLCLITDARTHARDWDFRARCSYFFLVHYFSTEVTAGYSESILGRRHNVEDAIPNSESAVYYKPSNEC